MESKVINDSKSVDWLLCTEEKDCSLQSLDI